jgi:uncharacterized protein (DUF1684 family)
VQHHIKQVEPKIHPNQSTANHGITEKLYNGFQVPAKLRIFASLMRSHLSLVFIIWQILLVSCNGTEVSKAENAETRLAQDTVWKRELLLLRSQKDNAFAASSSSPFNNLEEDFSGLKYFAPDKKWIIKTNWIRARKPETVKINDSKGKMRDYVFAGRLEFKADGKNYSLPAYFEGLEQKIMFVMFRDKTNGKSTYGGGRYLEFRIPDNEEIILDFNQAYNPYCHYNHNYSCPVVPENHKLEIEITAGERKYTD